MARPSYTDIPARLQSVAVLLVLLACQDSPPSTAQATPPPPTEAPPAAEAPPAPTPEPPAGPVLLSLDATGGGHGAPAGTNFILPPGVAATATAGALSDGSAGFKLVVDKPGDALVCTQAAEAGASFGFKARLKATVTPGPQAWQGLNIELRARDAAGALVSPPGNRYVVLGNLRADTAWGEVEGSAAMPAGATRGELCFRYVESTGAVEVDQITLVGVGGGADAGVRWELDAAGGENGAPAGAAFFLPTGVPGVTAEAGDLGDARGFRLSVASAANAVACSQPFPLRGKMEGRGRFRVKEVKPAGGAYTGFTLEVRNYDAAGQLIPGPGSQYLPLKVWREPTEWSELATAFTPPAAAVNGKLCVRFVDSTGVAEVDWLGVGAGG